MSSTGEGLALDGNSGQAERIPDEHREEYPFIGARNWRYKQEVSETVGDHLTTDTPRTEITAAQIARLLGDTPFEDGHFVKWGSTRYCDPSVHEGMDWFNADLKGNLEAYEQAVASRPPAGSVLVNGWSDRQVFEQKSGERVLWITQPVRLGQPESIKRNSGQVPAGFPVWVSAAGLGSRSVGLFAEVAFPTNNEYIQFTDAVILGKVNPDTGVAETPYHRLADDRDSEENKMYRGCRPKDGTLFVANGMANFVISHIDIINQ